MSTTVAIVGLGGLGMLQARALDELDEVELVGGADVAESGRDEYETAFGGPTYADFETLYDEAAPDAVTIVTPHTLHYEQVKAAFERDIHVHVEKPLVTTVAHADELIAMADERDLVFQVGYQRHFHPAYREMARLVEDGELGRVHMASCHLAQDWISGQEGTWRANPELSGGGQLIDSGSHLLDVLLWITDGTPAEVAALTDHWDHDVDVNSALSARLETPTGDVIASIGVSGDGHAFEEGLTIWGTEGMLEYRDGTLTVAVDGRPTYSASPSGEGYHESTKGKLGSFVDAIQTGSASPVPAEFGRRVTCLTEAAYIAAEEGRTVDATQL